MVRSFGNCLIRPAGVSTPPLCLSELCSSLPESPRQPWAKGDSFMDKMLLCANPSCRFLLDLSHADKSVLRSPLVLDGCPECGHGWLNQCPSCAEELSVAFTGHHPRCASCQ